ncbi:thiamine phosphate synthase [Natribacillus halophilus]|uniref:Thiazole tautomerase (Transcriptional regulator TenI) n=1 Tax=Natribacillus halophilus TaxID=549003 RepID=A0A1G8QAZ4_9BACI|nr:thiamine phosphate synthase [Natribacillus halophilus]SDJ01733.1 thiazole tautomerase (transcriptional regulator TenI) [Natribacillus halophilus]
MTWHLLTTNKWPFHIQVRQLRHAIKNIDMIHVRDKEASLQRLKQQIDQLRKIGVNRERIILNEHADAAIAWDLGGVHLPGHSSWKGKDIKEKAPGLQVGASVHSQDEAVTREEEGVDYLYYGHVFSSESKPDTPPRGLEALQAVVQSVSVPVMAIGGITRDRIAEVSQTGAAGIALISGFWEAERPEEEASYFNHFGQINYETT